MATCTVQWWIVPKGGDPRTDHAIEGTTRTQGWHPEDCGLTATKRGTLEPAWVLLQGEGTQRPQCVKRNGPENPGVAAPLAAADCRGNCWYAGRVSSEEFGGQRLRACRAPQLTTYMASGSTYTSEQCVQRADLQPD